MTAIAPRDLALLLLATLVWGFNLVASKVGVGQLPPLLFSALRFALLAAVLAPWLRIRRGHMGALVVAAILSGTLSFALLFAGIAVTGSVSSIAIAGQLGVPFTTLLSIALLGEQVRWRRWIGIVLSFAGVLVMGLDPQVFRAWNGLALAIASAFVGSLGLIAIKKLPQFAPLELQAWFAWISWPLLLGLSLLIERPSPALLTGVHASGWAALAFSAYGASLVGHTAFYHLVRRYPVTSVAPLTTLSPLFSVLFAVTLLHDRLTPRILAGGVCTLGGVWIIMLRERRMVDVGS